MTFSQLCSRVGLDKLFLFSCPLFFLTILKKLAHYSHALYPLFPYTCTIPVIPMLIRRGQILFTKYINIDQSLLLYCSMTERCSLPKMYFV